MMIVAIRKKWVLPLIMILCAGSVCFGLSRSPVSSVLAENREESISLPIIMYHSILADPQRAGTYVVSPATLENDLIYLKEKGYTSIFLCELIDYVKQNKPLPEKPVILTFDDGYLNNKTYLLPLLMKHNMKAVISVIGFYTDQYTEIDDPNPNYAHLTWDDIGELARSGYIEIQNHSYDMHKRQERKGTMRKNGESKAAYAEAFGSDVQKMQQFLKQKAGVEANTFTYPYGEISVESLEIIKDMGFQASLSCYEKINIINHDFSSLFELCRFNRASGSSSADFFSKRGID